MHGSIRLEPLFRPEPGSNVTRVNSAQANLQTHPCFQSSLFNDTERAAGTIKLWKERHPEIQATNNENLKKNLKDYQLENTIWIQSVQTLTSKCILL